jgi:hypothetical protein
LAAEGAPTPDELSAFAEQMGALQVDGLVLSAVSTFLAVGQAKVERGELAEARKSIEAALALLPHLSEEGCRALEPGLAQLQVAYATAASR